MGYCQAIFINIAGLLRGYAQLYGDNLSVMKYLNRPAFPPILIVMWNPYLITACRKMNPGFVVDS